MYINFGEDKISNNPLVSIIIPCYNYGHLIKFTIDSLLAQSYQNLEIIVIDDGSTDDSKNVILKLMEDDNRIFYINKKNGGMSSARNLGLRICKGDFIQFIDADDLLENDKIQFQVNQLLIEKNIDIVYTATKYFSNTNNINIFLDNNEIQNKGLFTISGLTTKYLKYLIQQNRITINAPLFRRKIINEIGFFDEKLKLVEDWDFWLRLFFNNYYIKYIDNTNGSCLVRIHDNNISKNDYKMILSSIQLRKKIRSKLIFRPCLFFDNELRLLFIKSKIDNTHILTKIVKYLLSIKKHFKN